MNRPGFIRSKFLLVYLKFDRTFISENRGSLRSKKEGAFGWQRHYPGGASPALIIGNRFAGLDNSRSNLEVGHPALVEHRAVAAFDLDFEPGLSIEQMVQIGVYISS